MKIDMHRRQFLLSAGVIAMAPWLSGFSGERKQSIVGTTMGTFFKMDFFDPTANVDMDSLRGEVRTLLENIENRMSLYRPTSELCRFNTQESVEWVPVSAETAQIIKAAQLTGTKSQGAFSCTVGAVSRRWGFGPLLVTDAQLAARAEAGVRPACVQPGVELSKDHRYLRKKDAAVEVDLNAIAKGDAVDKLAQLMEQHGVTRYLIEIGGEFYAATFEGAAPWSIGITHPEGGIVDVVQLNDDAIATSGDYIQERQLNDQRFTHLIDPDSALPIDSDLALVSVITNSAIEADAWATALQVMGLEQGLLFAKKNNMAALFLNRESGGYVGYATEPFDRYRIKPAGGEKWLRG